jgi:hypothetical protein
MTIHCDQTNEGRMARGNASWTRDLHTLAHGQDTRQLPGGFFDDNQSQLGGGFARRPFAILIARGRNFAPMTRSSPTRTLSSWAAIRISIARLLLRSARFIALAVAPELREPKNDES